jgi:hypothetical protein
VGSAFRSLLTRTAQIREIAMMAQPRELTSKDAPPPRAQRRESRRQSLERRLEDGYRRIDQAALTGADVTEWESFWIKLLGEYEDVCRESELAA